MTTYARAEPVEAGSARLGEGPRWDADRRRLLWVDIEAGLVHAFDPASGEDRAVACGATVGAVAPWAGDTVLVALADALAACDLAARRVQRLVDVPHPVPGMRCNDGACDPAGRFWVGTMRLDEAAGDAVLYRLDADGTLDPVLCGLGMSNGLGWDSSGRRMYFIDSLEQRVDVLVYDPATGEASGRRPFAEVPGADGVPDGLAVDEDGGVWVALHGGGEVRRLSPSGRLDGRVVVPEETVTACAFGGADGRTLFVTARSGLFAARVDVGGPPAQPFAGAAPRS